MSWTTADVGDLTGRVAVVTGGNGGLGLATASELAGAGAHVVLAARDRTKAAAAERRITGDHPGASAEVVGLDLADLASVRRAAGEIAAAHPAVDVLVNNAGLMAMPERRTADGFEMQLGVNHLGHHTLTALLLPTLLAADSARVVSVTSIARHMAPRLDPTNPHLAGRYRPWRAYGQSKLAGYHFGIGLQRRFRAAGVSAASLIAHPGLSHTDIQAHAVAEGGGGSAARAFRALTVRVGMSPERGALSILRAATDPAACGGELYAPRWGVVGPPVRRPILRRFRLDTAVEELWQMSERETGIALEVPS